MDFCQENKHEIMCGPEKDINSDMHVKLTVKMDNVVQEKEESSSLMYSTNKQLKLYLLTWKQMEMDFIKLAT
jgi:hypothetical protein